VHLVAHIPLQYVDICASGSAKSQQELFRPLKMKMQPPRGRRAQIRSNLRQQLHIISLLSLLKRARVRSACAVWESEKEKALKTARKFQKTKNPQTRD